MIFDSGDTGSEVSGYSIANSLRLRASASAYLSRTPATTTNQKKWTWAGWVKRSNLGLFGTLMSSGASFSTWMGFANSAQADGDNFGINLGNGVDNQYCYTTAVFRDPSAHYFACVRFDSDNATEANRLVIEINGVAQARNGTVALSRTVYFNTATAHYIGRLPSASNPFDGYLSNVHFIDGQALDSTNFGEFNSDGVWVPKAYSGTYGTNGFFLPFNDGSNLTELAKDRSGNGNNWTATNVSLSADHTYDLMSDTPTNSYCTLSPLNLYGALYDGNLRMMDTDSAAAYSCSSTFVLTTGKWYWEVTRQQASNTGYWGLVREGVNINGGNVLINANGYGYLYDSNGVKWDNSASIAAWGPTLAQGDVLGIAYDADTGKLFYSKNGSWINGAVPSAGTNPASTLPTTVGHSPAIRVIGSGGYEHTVLNFGQRPFAYAPPTGFKALCTANLPAVAIPNGRKHFDVLLWQGNAALGRTISGTQFQPDLVWAKSRTGSGYNHLVMDSVRGASKALITNQTTAELTDRGIATFNANGFTLDNQSATRDEININSSHVEVAWNWKAGGAAVTNTAGSITSQVSANTTAGISIGTFTGTAANATVGHGLPTPPEFIIVARRATGGAYWGVYHKDAGNTHALYLQTTDARQANVSFWNNTTPTSSVFSIGTSANTNAAGTMVFWAFSSVPGFSRFGSYTGTGSADGPFVFCGFRPRWVMVKRTDTTSDWLIVDTARSPANLVFADLYPNLSNAENTSTATSIDLLSNGFKLRGTTYNQTGSTQIFIALAESPFGGSNVAPATAR